MTSTGGKIVRGAAIVSVCTLLAKLLAVVQKLVMGPLFGTGKEADAFFLAFNSIINAFYNVTKTSLAPFLPLFAEKQKAQGEAEAWGFASTVGSLLFYLLVAMTLLGFLAAPLLIHFFPHQGIALTAVKLVRLMLPFVFLMGLASLAFLILNAYKVFLFPALGDVVSKILIILALVVFYRQLGIYALALGVVLGAAACLFLQAGALRNKWPLFRFAIAWRDPLLRTLGWLILPVLAGVVLSQLRTFIDAWFAAAIGEGCIAGLGYARGLTDTLILLVPAAVGVAIYPFFSDLAAREEKTELAVTLLRSLRLLAFLFIPLAVGIILLRYPLVQLVYERGKFSAESVGLTTGPLFCYALGLPAFAFETIIVMFFFALKDTKTPVIVGVLTLLVHVSLILCLRGALLHNSIALAYSLAKSLKVVVLLVLLMRWRGFDLQPRKSLLFLAKVLLCAAVMAGVIYLAQRWFRAHIPIPRDLGKWRKAMRLALVLGGAVLAGAAAYAASALLLGLEEAKHFAGRLAGLVRK